MPKVLRPRVILADDYERLHTAITRLLSPSQVVGTRVTAYRCSTLRRA